MPRMLPVYAFAAVIGLLGGPIITAAQLYAKIGWTATWVEIGNWGVRDQSGSLTTPVDGPGWG